MAIKHRFVNAHADGPDATITRPSDWNAGHDVSKGVAAIDFGAFPGSNEAFIAVTGQADILADSCVSVGVLATNNDAAYAAMLIGLSVGDIVPGTGFTVYARSQEKMQGTFSVQWAWA